MKKTYFHPGCTLSMYKPALIEKAFAYAKTRLPLDSIATACCRHQPPFDEPVDLLTVCTGCYNRMKHEYEMTDTISFWQFVDEDPNFPFPDHSGLTVTIQDMCTARDYPFVHDAVRSLLQKMHIAVIEDDFIRAQSKCCGDRMLKVMSVPEVEEYRYERMQAMPGDHIAVYCASCIEAVDIGQKTPYYLLDLLFDEPTTPPHVGTEKWMGALMEHRASHTWE